MMLTGSCPDFAAHVANGCGMAGEESIREMLRMTKETWRLVKEEW